MPKFCTNCGFPLYSNANFCGNCGARIIDTQAVDPVEAAAKFERYDSTGNTVEQFPNNHSPKHIINNPVGELIKEYKYGFERNGEDKALVIETYKEKKDTFDIIRFDGQIISNRYRRIEVFSSWDNGFITSVDKTVFKSAFIIASLDDLYFREIPNLETLHWRAGLLSSIFDSFYKEFSVIGFDKDDPIYEASWYRLGTPHKNEILSYLGLYKVISCHSNPFSTTLKISKIRDVI